MRRYNNQNEDQQEELAAGIEAEPVEVLAPQPKLVHGTLKATVRPLRLPCVFALCVSSAFVANTLPLPRVSSASVAKTLPLPRVSCALQVLAASGLKSMDRFGKNDPCAAIHTKHIVNACVYTSCVIVYV